MANMNWTKTRLIKDLEELHHLLGRARRESRGSPDDIVAERLLRQLIKRRQAQIRAIRGRSRILS